MLREKLPIYMVEKLLVYQRRVANCQLFCRFGFLCLSIVKSLHVQQTVQHMKCDFILKNIHEILYVYALVHSGGVGG